MSTRNRGELVDFPHDHQETTVAKVEISVYPPGDQKRPRTSSITHRTMERVTLAALRELIAGMRKDTPDA